MSFNDAKKIKINGPNARYLSVQTGPSQPGSEHLLDKQVINSNYLRQLMNLTGGMSSWTRRRPLGQILTKLTRRLLVFNNNMDNKTQKKCLFICLKYETCSTKTRWNQIKLLLFSDEHTHTHTYMYSHKHKLRRTFIWIWFLFAFLTWQCRCPGVDRSSESRTHWTTNLTGTTEFCRNTSRNTENWSDYLDILNTRQILLRKLERLAKNPCITDGNPGALFWSPTAQSHTLKVDIKYFSGCVIPK